MCGRFVLKAPFSELVRLYGLTNSNSVNLEPRYNIAPTDPVAAVRTHHETVTALWAVCGHVAEVRVADLWRKFPGFKRIADIKLWCTRCGERKRIELDATKALGNDCIDD